MLASLPLVIVEIANQSVSQGDIIVVGAISSARNIGIYGAASRVSLLLLLPSVVLSTVLGSVVTDLHARGEIARLGRLLRRAALVATVPMLLITVVMWIFGRSILGLVFGDTYRSGALVLAILVVGPLVNTLSGLCGMTLVMTGHQRTMVWVAGFTGPLTIALEVAAGHIGGITGVAVASSFGTVLQNALLTFQAWRKIGILTLPILHPTPLLRGGHHRAHHIGGSSREQ
jgi:O-antigen/teichoic acid export membrane protein